MDTLSRRTLSAGFTGCVVALAFAGSVGTAVAQSLRDVTIGVSSTSFISVPVQVANGLGLFKKNGLNATVKIMTDASVGTTALISGSIDFMVGGAVNAVVSQLRGQDIVVVSSIYKGYAGSLILSKETVDKLGVSPTAPVADRMKALNGLLIASPSASSNYTLTPQAAAKSVGANVRFTYMDQPAMGAALKTGAIQGYVSGAPFWAPPIVAGYGVMWLSGAKGEFAYDFIPASSSLLETMRNYANANPDVIKALRASFVDFVELLRKNPEQVEAHVKTLYPNLDAKTVSLLFASESPSLNTLTYTVDDLKHDIDYIKAGGVQLQNIEKLDPATLILK